MIIIIIIIKSVFEINILLRCYATYNANMLIKAWEKILVTSSTVKHSKINELSDPWRG